MPCEIGRVPAREAKISIGQFEKRKGLLLLGDVRFGSKAGMPDVQRDVR